MAMNSTRASVAVHNSPSCIADDSQSLMHCVVHISESDEGQDSLQQRHDYCYASHVSATLMAGVAVPSSKIGAGWQLMAA